MKYCSAFDWIETIFDFANIMELESINYLVAIFTLSLLKFFLAHIEIGGKTIISYWTITVLRSSGEFLVDNISFLDVNSGKNFMFSEKNFETKAKYFLKIIFYGWVPGKRVGVGIFRPGIWNFPEFFPNFPVFPGHVWQISSRFLLR